MSRAPESPLPHLRLETWVVTWRVEALQGQCAYGAVRMGQKAVGPVALKMALYPWDARFTREAELLARLSHPGIPRLLDCGVLHHAVSGTEYPITYTVGFGINSNLLKNTAAVGGGVYYTADDAASLKQALLDIIHNVQTQATSFSSPAASTQ